MFFTYVFRELRRRHRQALLTAMGLAVGVALVVAVTAYAAGVGEAQDQVLQSLYGVGTDITVSQQQKMDQSGPQRFGMQPPDQSKQGQKFSRSRVMTTPGQQSISTKRLAQIAVAGRCGLRHRQHHDEHHQRGGEVRAGAGRLRRRRAARRAPRSSSGSSSSQQAQTQMSPINVSQLSVSGVDTTNLGLGPLSSAQISSGRSLTSADAKDKVVPRHQGLRQAELARRGRHQEARRQEVHRRRHRRPARRKHFVRPVRPAQLGSEAQRQRGQGQPDLREGRPAPTTSPPSRRRSSRSCPRRR